MSTSIIPSTPAEALNIAPENLEIANCYLTCQDLVQVSQTLDITPERVTQALARREVKAYIDHVFMDYGFNNRFRIRNIMDTVINKKLEEMQEADVGSSKDISDLLALSHKMTMDILDKQIKLEESKAKSTSSIKNQTNIQLNDSGGSNYQRLLDKLINKPKS